MDEQTARALDLIYRSEVEIEHLEDEVIRLRDLQRQALSALHDIAVEQHAVAIVLQFPDHPSRGPA